MMLVSLDFSFTFSTYISSKFHFLWQAQEFGFLRQLKNIKFSLYLWIQAFTCPVLNASYKADVPQAYYKLRQKRQKIEENPTRLNIQR